MVLWNPVGVQSHFPVFFLGCAVFTATPGFVVKPLSGLENGHHLATREVTVFADRNPSRRCRLGPAWVEESHRAVIGSKVASSFGREYWAEKFLGRKMKRTCIRGFQQNSSAAALGLCHTVLPFRSNFSARKFFCPKKSALLASRTLVLLPYGTTEPSVAASDGASPSILLRRFSVQQPC